MIHNSEQLVAPNLTCQSLDLAGKVMPLYYQVLKPVCIVLFRSFSISVSALNKSLHIDLSGDGYCMCYLDVPVYAYPVPAHYL